MNGIPTPRDNDVVDILVRHQEVRKRANSAETEACNVQQLFPFFFFWTSLSVDFSQEFYCWVSEEAIKDAEYGKYPLKAVKVEEKCGVTTEKAVAKAFNATR